MYINQTLRLTHRSYNQSSPPQQQKSTANTTTFRSHNPKSQPKLRSEIHIMSSQEPKQLLVNELIFLMNSLFNSDPICPVLDSHLSVERALEIIKIIEFMPGIADLGDFDPKAEAIRTTYEEMNIFSLDGEKDERIPIDKIHETCRNPIVRIPTSQRNSYVVAVVIDRLEASLKRNDMKDLGEHFETSIAELLGENETRGQKLLVLSNRYTALGERYPAMDLDTPSGCFLKWVRDSLKEILALTVLGDLLVEAVIGWYRQCLERYIITRDAGVYDLGTQLKYFRI